MIILFYAILFPYSGWKTHRRAHSCAHSHSFSWNIHPFSYGRYFMRKVLTLQQSNQTGHWERKCHKRQCGSRMKSNNGMRRWEEVTVLDVTKASFIHQIDAVPTRFLSCSPTCTSPETWNTNCNSMIGRHVAARDFPISAADPDADLGVAAVQDPFSHCSLTVNTSMQRWNTTLTMALAVWNSPPLL